MKSLTARWLSLGLMATMAVGTVGCHSFSKFRGNSVCGDAGCGDAACGDPACGEVCESGCDECETCEGSGFCGKLCGGFHLRSHAIPERYPLGSVNRAHFHTMQTNAEAADFIIHRHEFVDETAELTPYGRDHLLEISARMRSTPFPVIVERTENNADPELDQFRRDLIAEVLADLGNPDAPNRTVVSQSYGLGKSARESEFEYYQYIYSGNQFNNFGNNGGAGNGFGNGFGGGGGGYGF